MAENIRSWDRQPDETDKAWAAFQLYRDMPVFHQEPLERRSLANLATKLGYSSLTTLTNWSKKYEWVNRCRAFDTQLSIVNEEAQLASVVEYRNAVLQITGTHIGNLHELLAASINRAKKALEEGEPLKGREIVDLTKAAETLDNLMRRSAQMPTTYEYERVQKPEIDETEKIFVM